MPSRPILVADDQPDVRKSLFEALTRAGYAVVLAEHGGEALDKFSSHRFDLIIAAVQMPRLDGMTLLSKIRHASPETPVILITDQGTVDHAVEAMKNGAFDYLLKPLSNELILETVSRGLKSNPTCRISNSGGPQISAKEKYAIISQDPGMGRLLEMAANVAPSRATVLICGESGTGKELLARFIHQASNRAGGPFVAVNCAALPEGLLESELFGHEKGSFTGAIARKIGKFELANQGTLMLDEISEMDLGLQAKLLRVLQENEVDRVGGRGPVSVDVRVIATTNRDLRQWIEQGNFRQDLYYRLNVIPLTVPPLKDRSGDIPRLTRHFLEKYSHETGEKPKKLSSQALARLKLMDWPGNVRELENIIARGILLAKGDVVEPGDLFPELGHQPHDRPEMDRQNPDHDRPEETENQGTEFQGRTMTIKEMEKALINKALRQTDGNRTHAAKILGISVRTLRNKLAEYKSAGWKAGQAA